MAHDGKRWQQPNGQKRSISSLSDDYLQEPCQVVALSYSVEAPFDKVFFWTPGQEEEYLVFVG